MCILDGNKYASRCREEGEQSWDILRDCMVLRNQRREPLLTSSACANDYETPQARRHSCRSAPLVQLCYQMCCEAAAHLLRPRQRLRGAAGE